MLAEHGTRRELRACLAGSFDLVEAAEAAEHDVGIPQFQRLVAGRCRRQHWAEICGLGSVDDDDGNADLFADDVVGPVSRLLDDGVPTFIGTGIDDVSGQPGCRYCFRQSPSFFVDFIFPFLSLIDTLLDNL